MRSALLLILLAPACLAQNVQYLSGIQQRWDASDLVCIGNATDPVRTGVIEKINGEDRDQRAADVDVETCLKGSSPSPAIHVLGDDVVAVKRVSQGFAYAGPPTGFLNPGRNLLFLRSTTAPDKFTVTVPVFETAIPLAEDAPPAPPPASPRDTHAIITRELEAALLQLGRDDQSIPGKSDLSYINDLFDYLGRSRAPAELTRLAAIADPTTRSDIAVALLARGQAEDEAAAISALLDSTADYWRRENAASALGFHGTAAAIEPLRQVAAQPAPNATLEELRASARASLQQLQRHLQISHQ